jgi:hypothetical protein
MDGAHSEESSGGKPIQVRKLGPYRVAFAQDFACGPRCADARKTAQVRIPGGSQFRIKYLRSANSPKTAAQPPKTDNISSGMCSTPPS